MAANNGRLVRDELTTLEHSTLKVPYELLNKKFRTVQKVIDREMTHMNSSVTELASTFNKPSLTTSEASASIDGLVQRLTTLKRKAEEGIDEELEYARLCHTRLEHLKAYATEDQTDGMKNAWRKIRIDRLLVDHFLREGHYSTAVMLAKSSNIEDLVDVSVFQVCIKVESALRNHHTGPCLAWCHDNRSKLRRLKSSLEYQIRLQDFIELIRQEKRSEAVKYARKHLSSGGEEMLGELKSAMALLAFSPSTTCKKYRRMFSPKRWDELITQFRQENLSLYQLNSSSVLSVSLQAGLAALKTPHCYKPEEHNTQCPVCSEVFNQLATPLPFSHSSQSYLICRLSGQPMDEHNPPMLLPNGYVYGEHALQQAAKNNNGMIACPRTGDILSFSDVKKVFVM